MTAVPKPKKKAKKRKKRRPNNLERYYCPVCKKDFFLDTLAAKKEILVHLHSEICKKRDRHTCQYCNNKNKNELVVHHIFGQKAYPAGKWVIDNGVTICIKDHMPVAHGKPEAFRRWVIPWMFMRMNKFYIRSIPENQAEEMYDWLFAHVQEVKQFRACDFESEKAKLEKELEEK